MLKGVVGDHDQIGLLADLDRSDAMLDAQHLGGAAGARLEDSLARDPPRVELRS